MAINNQRNMTPQEQQQKADNLVIKVNGRKSVETCSIVEYFEEKFTTKSENFVEDEFLINGIPLIEGIKKEINKEASTSGIEVRSVDKNKLLFELQGQEGLKLKTLLSWLYKYLEIK